MTAILTPQIATCSICGRTFVLTTPRQIAGWLSRGERCPRCGGASV